MVRKNNGSLLSLKGVGVVEGVAKGPLFQYINDGALSELRKLGNSTEIEHESVRFHGAIDHALDTIHKEKLHDKNGSEPSTTVREILATHEAMIRDPVICRQVDTVIKEQRIDAPHAMQMVLQRLKNAFGRSGSSSIEAKCVDLDDVFRRMLVSLGELEALSLSSIPPDSIVVSERFLPSDTLYLNERSVSGIIAQEGGKYSHTALLARNLGIPFVSGIPTGVIRALPKPCTALIDGGRGIVTIFESRSSHVSPGKAQGQRHGTAGLSRPAPRRAREVGNWKVEGVRPFLAVSATSEVDADFLKRFEGIGLVRTESFYIRSGYTLSDDELVEAVGACPWFPCGKEITLRLADIGGDKVFGPFKGRQISENPLLGQRGVRVLRAQPELLRSQLAAFLRLSGTMSIRILIPMVTLAEDVISVKEELQRQKARLESISPIAGHVPLGAMIETPCALASIREIAEVADFICFGTSDLAQYFVAADREQLSVSHYFEEGLKRLVPLICGAVRSVVDSGRRCMVCGEMVAHPWTVGELKNAGLTEACFELDHITQTYKEDVA